MLTPKSIVHCMVLFVMLLGFSPLYGWTLYMNFNAGPLDESVEDQGQSYPVFTDAAGHTVYSACESIAIDGQCAKMSVKKGHDGWGVWGGRIHFSGSGVSNPKRGSEIWYSVKIFFPEGFDYTASPHLKFLRLHTGSASTQSEGYNDLYITPDGATHWSAEQKKNVDNPFFFIKEGQNLQKLFGDFNNDRPRLGVWETYEVYLKLDSESVSSGKGDSRVRVWKNGKLLAELDDIKTLSTPESYADALLIFTYWNGGNPNATGAYPTQDQSVYIDDLIITTDRPAGEDSFGNPMIGSTLLKRPNPPTGLTVTK